MTALMMMGTVYNNVAVVFSGSFAHQFFLEPPTDDPTDFANGVSVVCLFVRLLVVASHQTTHQTTTPIENDDVQL